MPACVGKTKETCVSIGDRDPFLWQDALSMPTPDLLVFVYIIKLPEGICLSVYLSIGSCSLYTHACICLSVYAPVLNTKTNLSISHSETKKEPGQGMTKKKSGIVTVL